MNYHYDMAVKKIPKILEIYYFQSVVRCEESNDPENIFRPKDCSCPMKGDPKKHGEEWTHPEDSCQTCDCRNGKVSCSKVKILKSLNKKIFF